MTCFNCKYWLQIYISSSSVIISLRENWKWKIPNYVYDRSPRRCDNQDVDWSLVIQI